MEIEKTERSFTRRFLGMIALTLSLLCIPLIAMQFTAEVNWTGLDFTLAGILLLSLGLSLQLVFSKFKSTRTKLIIAGVVLALFLLLWIELAVGLFH